MRKYEVMFVKRSKWAAITALFLVGVLAWACAGLEFGMRPAQSIVPLPLASDVKYVEANGIRFGYIEKGAGPLVLLFHGYPETARSWAAVQERLAASGYHVVALFMRGYPPTSFPSNGDYTIAVLGTDVLSLIDAFGAHSAVVVGHDWGASAVYTAAAQNPSKIRGLVALSIPHPRGIAGDPKVLLKANHFIYYQLPWSRRIVWSHNFAHIDSIYRRWAPNFQPSLEEIGDIKSTLKAPGAIDGALGYYWSFFKGRSGAGAAPESTISVPALVIAGASDGSIDASRFSNARPAFTGPYTFVELASVGHFPQMEAPDAVAEAILSFLKTVQ